MRKRNAVNFALRNQSTFYSATSSLCSPIPSSPFVPLISVTILYSCIFWTVCSSVYLFIHLSGYYLLKTNLCQLFSWYFLSKVILQQKFYKSFNLEKFWVTVISKLLKFSIGKCTVGLMRLVKQPFPKWYASKIIFFEREFAKIAKLSTIFGQHIFANHQE